MNSAALLEFYYDDERERRNQEAREDYLRQEAFEQVARAMLAAGKPRAEIIQFTNLTEQDIDRLQ